jgi:hypothetical protein
MSFGEDKSTKTIADPFQLFVYFSVNSAEGLNDVNQMCSKVGLI